MVERHLSLALQELDANIFMEQSLVCSFDDYQISSPCARFCGNKIWREIIYKEKNGQQTEAD